MSWLIAQFWPYLAAAGAALVAIVAAYSKGRGDGKSKQLAKEAKARDQNIKDVRRAQDAAAAVQRDPVDELRDPHNRDNRS